MQCKIYLQPTPCPLPVLSCPLWDGSSQASVTLIDTWKWTWPCKEETGPNRAWQRRGLSKKRILNLSPEERPEMGHIS